MSCPTCAQWHEVANDLAIALRPYSMFREQRIVDGRIVVDVTVPGITLSKAHAALERLGQHVYEQQHARQRAQRKRPAA